MKEIDNYRQEIDRIDEELLHLFEQRMEVSEKIGQYKKTHDLPETDPKREEEILKKDESLVQEKWVKDAKDFHQELFRLSKKNQKKIKGEGEDFLKGNADYSDYVDAAFSASRKAKSDIAAGYDTLNATLGSLYGEDGLIKSFTTVYDTYAKIDSRRKTSYSSSIAGNDDFNEEVFKWINRNENLHLYHRGVASPGGTGAIALIIDNCLERNETLLIPDVAWGSYRLMAKKNDLKIREYSFVKGEEISLEDLKYQCEKLMDEQGKTVVVINDPCQNPTGVSLGKERWIELVSFFNELSKKGPVLVLNDIAYIDYAYDQEHVTDYLSAFNEAPENVVFAIAFSTSKSLTAYGMRLGECVLLGKDPAKVDHLANAFIRDARSSWGSANNGFMDCFVKLMREHKEEYLREKEEAILELKKRSDIFLTQAKETGLPIYPYKEGFFVTLKVEGERLDRFQKELEKEHIYGVKFKKGMRIAICSLSIEKTDGLAFRLKEILDHIQ